MISSNIWRLEEFSDYHEILHAKTEDQDLCRTFFRNWFKLLEAEICRFFMIGGTISHLKHPVCSFSKFLNSQVNVKKSVEKIPTKLGRWFSNHWDVHFKKNNYYPKVLFRYSWNSTLKKSCKNARKS